MVIKGDTRSLDNGSHKSSDQKLPRVLEWFCVQRGQELLSLALEQSVAPDVIEISI